jgi:hypothetical protein
MHRTIKIKGDYVTLIQKFFYQNGLWKCYMICLMK